MVRERMKESQNEIKINERETERDITMKKEKDIERKSEIERME